MRVAAALLALLACAAAQNLYDPCNKNGAHSPVTKGDGGHPIGLAFWINGKLEDWDPVVTTVDPETNETNTTAYSLHPCTNKAYMSSLLAPPGVLSNATNAPAVWTAIYLPETDSMAVLHTDVTQQNTLLDYYTAKHVNDTLNVTYEVFSPPPPGASSCTGLLCLAPPPPPASEVNHTYAWNLTAATNAASFVSVVAYYGTGGGAVRSEPRYVRSANASLTIGTGQVSQLILIARYTAGVLSYLQWADMGCSGCGGTKAPGCMQVGSETTNRACAGTAAKWQSNATCYTYINSTVSTTDANNVTTTVSNSYSPCATGVYLGFSGTDQYGKPLKTGGQMEMLRKYSVSRLGSQALGYARNAASYARSQVPAVPTSTNSGEQLGRKR